jgi:hypothetical protein
MSIQGKSSSDAKMRGAQKRPDCAPRNERRTEVDSMTLSCLRLAREQRRRQTNTHTHTHTKLRQDKTRQEVSICRKMEQVEQVVENK